MSSRIREALPRPPQNKATRVFLLSFRSFSWLDFVAALSEGLTDVRLMPITPIVAENCQESHLTTSRYFMPQFGQISTERYSCLGLGVQQDERYAFCSLYNLK